MKVLLSARALLGICIVLLCINLCVMLLRSPQPTYAEEKKADAAFTYQLVRLRPLLDRTQVIPYKAFSENGIL